MVSLIETFHTGMVAQLRIGDQLLDDFAVENGLRQGCTMAPVLFNIYMCAVVDQWQNVTLTNSEVGIDVMSHGSDQLFNARLNAASSTCAAEFQFANDGALLAKIWNGSKSALQLFVDVATSFRLRINAMKTKFMAVGTGAHETDMAPLFKQSGPRAYIRDWASTRDWAYNFQPPGTCALPIIFHLFILYIYSTSYGFRWQPKREDVGDSQPW